MGHIGYTTGTFDLFHSGHVNFLRMAKELCGDNGILIVGVTSDELGTLEKNKTPIISLKDRMAVVEACRYVDKVVVHNDRNGDKISPYNKYRFDRVFIGDDYIDDEKYNDLPNKIPVKVFFLGYSHHISSTEIRNKLLEN